MADLEETLESLCAAWNCRAAVLFYLITAAAHCLKLLAAEQIGFCKIWEGRYRINTSSKY